MELKQMITPLQIIEIIKKTYDVDVTEKGMEGSKRNLRPIYYYLCQRYCNSALYTFVEIGKFAKVNHSSVSQMTERVAERLNIRGYEHFTIIIKTLCKIIENDYPDNHDYLDDIELDDFTVLKLKRKLREYKYRNMAFSKENNILKRQIIKLQK